MSFSIPSLKSFLTPVTIVSASTASTILLHFNGINGQTTTTDSSSNAISTTINSYIGTASLSSTYTKFGTTSFGTDTNIGYITFPNSSLFNFGSNDWTIDFWWLPVRAGSSAASTSFAHFCSNFAAGVTAPIAGIILSKGGSLNNEIRIRISTDGTSYILDTTTTSGIWDGITGGSTWYHIAIERYGSNINLYVNGSKTVLTSTLSGSIYYNATNPCCFGGGFLGTTAPTTTTYSQAYFDELRIINGIAKYQGIASFSVPTSEYTS